MVPQLPAFLFMVYKAKCGAIARKSHVSLKSKYLQGLALREVFTWSLIYVSQAQQKAAISSNKTAINDFPKLHTLQPQCFRMSFTTVHFEYVSLNQE